MKKILSAVSALILCVATAAAAPKNYKLTSPDGSVVAEISAGETVSYTLSQDGTKLIAPSRISMEFMYGGLFAGGKVKKASRRSIDKTFTAPVYRRKNVSDRCNELTLTFQNHDIVFRAYDNGFAYRFVSHVGSAFKVRSENVEFNFPEDFDCLVAYTNGNVKADTWTPADIEANLGTSFEQTYTAVKASEVSGSHFAFLPVSAAAGDGHRMVITETALYDYPGMYIYGDGKSLRGYHACCPSTLEQGGHNNLQMLVRGREEYIAAYDGDTSFPWRVVALSRNDAELLGNDLAFILAPEQDKDFDFSFVRPGKVAWDWWNAWNIYGVDFKSGINNETYKYYIDFAAKSKIEYVILDEGWAVKGEADLMNVIPEIDLPSLVEYARSKGVGIILWAGYWAFARDMENVCRHYSEMGVKGFKVDFMDRDDQQMVNFHLKAAQMCAKYGLMIDFHGTYKPVGLHRTYPNVVNYEGVHGLEQMKWSAVGEDQVTYDVTIPFIRQIAGPMDYTQGAMRNASKSNYFPVRTEPMSQGTRCRQLAEYVVFEAPLTMMCDSPSNYMAERECTSLIASVPTVWDETVPLDGKVGEYVAIARRSGDDWWVGAMTDWDPKTLSLDLSFLPDGKYDIRIFADGVNADKAACDYKVTSGKLEGRSLEAVMAPGGGYIAHISPESKVQQSLYYVKGEDLTIVGKLMDTPNPWHRVDTVKYKGFTSSENLQVRCPAGVAIAFSTDSDQIWVHPQFGDWRAAENSTGHSYHGFDLYIKKDGRWIFANSVSNTQKHCDEPLRVLADIVPGEKECLLYLPIYSELRSIEIGVKKGSFIKASENPFRHRIAAFGSSFTHGASTSRAGMSYPKQFERMTGLQILNLGCSGNCKLQDYFADVLCDVEADAFIFDTFSNPSSGQIEERLFPFIEKLRAAHPGVPFIFQETIVRGRTHFSTEVDSRETLRKEVAARMMQEACSRYEDVYFIHPDATDHVWLDESQDGTHPSDMGYRLWAESIIPQILPIFAKYGIE